MLRQAQHDKEKSPPALFTKRELNDSFKRVQSETAIKSLVLNHLSTHEKWGKKENKDQMKNISFLLGKTLFTHREQFKGHLPTEEDTQAYQNFMSGITLR